MKKINKNPNLFFIKKAFTLVEILIAISILTILSLVAYNSYDNFINSSNNSRIRADLDTLNLALKNYSNINNNLPDPQWNKNYFDYESNYSHSSSWAFWVYGQATKTLLDSKYIDFVPRDPRLDIYYSYWKALWKNEFEVAWVLKKDWDYISLVKWNYKWDTWPINLIRSYDGPEFVYNGSKLEFPYNPEQKVLIAKIRKLTWTVEINGKSYNNLSDIEKIDLLEWTKIKTWTNSWDSVEIYFSDWSVSVLEANSELTLTNMKYKEKNSLFTNIKIFLKSWKLWTKATKLSKESEFQVYTNDAITAVRWTIFWVENDWTNIKVKLVEWKIQVKKNTSWFFPELSWTMSSTGIIEVSEWQNPKWIKLWTRPSSENISSEDEKILKSFWRITKNNRVELVSYSRHKNIFEIKLKDLSQANYIKISTWTTENYNLDNFRQWNLIVLNNENLNWSLNSWDLKIKLCKDSRCNESTTPLTIKNLDKVDYSLEWSDMVAYEPFWKNTLGDWEIKWDEEELDEIYLSWSNLNTSYWGILKKWHIIEYWTGFITFSWSNEDDRWATYKYNNVWVIKNFLNDIYDSNIDYKVELKLIWNREASYELLFGNDSNQYLFYTSNPEEYYKKYPSWYDNSDGSRQTNNKGDTFFDWEKWNNYNEQHSASLKNDGYFYNDKNPHEEKGWWQYIYKFNKDRINTFKKTISFNLKEEFWDSEFTKNILKNLDFIGFYVNKTYPWTNDQTSVTLSDFKITKVKRNSSIKSSDFELVAYAPYNKVGDLNLYDSGSQDYGSTSSDWILNWTEWAIWTEEICDENLSDTWSSFCQIWDVKGVFIDGNDDIKDSLKYEFTWDKALNSWSWFVIEMSVRGEDLKGWLKYLFQFEKWLNTNIAYGNLSFWSWSTIIKINLTSLSNLNDNEFYKVESICKKWKWILQIVNENGAVLNSVKWDLNSCNGIEYSNLNIWSTNLSFNQWDWVIDYLKIYKNK